MNALPIPAKWKSIIPDPDAVLWDVSFDCEVTFDWIPVRYFAIRDGADQARLLVLADVEEESSLPGVCDLGHAPISKLLVTFVRRLAEASPDIHGASFGDVDVCCMSDPGEYIENAPDDLRYSAAGCTREEASCLIVAGACFELDFPFRDVLMKISEAKLRALCRQHGSLLEPGALRYLRAGQQLIDIRRRAKEAGGVRS